MVIDKISATSTRVIDTELDEFDKLFEFLLFNGIFRFESEVACSDMDDLSVRTERQYIKMHQARGAMSIMTITISQLSS